MAKQVELTVEQLTQTVENLIKKQESSDELRSAVIKLQEDLIGELIEQLNITKERAHVSFKAGVFFGLVIGTVICIIINLIMTTIR
jgi:hypothetical protein